MFKNLYVFNFQEGYDPSDMLTKYESHDAFVLKTCQRTILAFYRDIQQSPKFFELLQSASSQSYSDVSAYKFLLEVSCGLQSKLLGENEIVSQVRLAYTAYLKQKNRNKHLIQILEKLFKDTKEIRSRYLIGLSQKTYASLARKHLYQALTPQKILILGSGNLAIDLINQFKKRSEVYVSARNPEKLLQLAQDHAVKPVDWSEQKYWLQFNAIANTIGFDGTLLDHDFFSKWEELNSHKLFIDLGSPSPIKTHFEKEQGVIRLDHIFEEGAVHQKNKHEKVTMAQKALQDLAQRRHELMNRKLIKAQKYRLAHV